MKKSTKIIRLSVALLLLIAMLLTPMSPIFAVVIDGSGDADLTAADIVSEDASKREKFSRHYLTGDGTYFAVSYAEQVNYQDDDGNWIAVDNSLSTNVLTGEKSTKNEKFKVKFANKANKEDLVTIKTSEYDVSFGITVSEDGVVHVDASINMDEFCRYFDIRIDTECALVSAYVQEQLDKLPEIGDTFDVMHLTITVSELDIHHMTMVDVVVHEREEEED